MNTKYNLTYKDYFGTQWDHDFQFDGTFASIIDLIGTGKDPVVVNYEASDYFTHSPIKASSVEIKLIELTDDAYIDFFRSDKVCKHKIYKNSNLFWQGWTIAEGYNSLYNLTPKSVTLLTVDGLTFLKDITLSVTETGAGAIDEPGIYAMYKFFKQAFDQIGLSTLIYESLNIYDYRINQALSPFTELNLDTWSFYDEKYQTLYDVLEKILTVQGARLYQKDGCWYIDHIKQLNLGTITYRVYTAAFAPSSPSTSVEDRTYSITSKSGSPLLVPINHSLYKELEYPFSRFTITCNYGFNKNIIRYPTVFEMNGDHDYEIVSNKELKIHGIFGGPFELEGVIYDLGRIDLTGLDFDKPILNVHISGTCFGHSQALLYIINESDQHKYYYDIEGRIWIEEISIHIASFTGLNNLITFNNDIEIYKGGTDYKGHLYLLINPPNAVGIPVGKSSFLTIDLDSLAVEYLEQGLESSDIIIENTDYITNKKVIELNLYSEPKLIEQTIYGGITTEHIRDMVNPILLYPGMFYYWDGSLFVPCFAFVFGDNESNRIESLLAQDIMSFYANLRFKLLGTLLGQIDFGKVLDYDSRRYMIASMNYNLKRSEIEVTLLQIGDITGYMLNDDGTYILDDQGNKIPV